MGRDNVMKREQKLAGWIGRVMADVPIKPTLTAGTASGGRATFTVQLNTPDGVTINHAEPVRIRLWDSFAFNSAHGRATVDVQATTDGTTWGTTDNADTDHHTSKTGGLAVNIDNTSGDVVYITVEPRAGSNYIWFSSTSSIDFA